jgi:hypothetical protein
MVRYRMYDAMPQELRTFLQDFIVNLSPEQPYSMWKSGAPIRSIIQGGHAYFQSSPHSTERVYGRSHPDNK